MPTTERRKQLVNAILKGRPIPDRAEALALEAAMSLTRPPTSAPRRALAAAEFKKAAGLALVPDYAKDKALTESDRARIRFMIALAERRAEVGNKDQKALALQALSWLGNVVGGGTRPVDFTQMLSLIDYM